MPRWSRALGVAALLLLADLTLVSRLGAAPAFPLHADAGSRTLVDANGQPFLIMGDAAWSLIAQLNQAQVVQYLSNRKAHGFNTVLVNLIEHKFAAKAPADIFGDQPFSTPGDFSTPNGTYFDYAEWVIAQAQKQDLLVLLAPMYLGYPGKDEGWYNELKANGPDKAQAFGQYVGQRFAKYPNIIWLQGGDTAQVDPANNIDATAEVNALVAGIQSADSTHLITAEGSRGDSSLDDWDNGWLSLDAIYTDCAGAQTKALSEWQRGAAMPFFHTEGVYENEGASSQCLLDQMYYPVLLGARGHVFGNRPMWLFAPGWPQALASAGTRLVMSASKLFTTREGATLEPQTGVVVAGGGTAGQPGYAAAARTASGKSVLVYVPPNNPATRGRILRIDTTQVPGPAFVAWWFNPRAGTASRVPGTFKTGGIATFTSPVGGPWVLVLDDATLRTRPGQIIRGIEAGDVVWQHKTTGGLQTWFMENWVAQSGVALTPGAVNPSSGWQIRGRGDFDGDGNTDLVWQNMRTGDLSVWLMNTTVARASVRLNPARLAAGWQVVGVADFNGDGKPDILMQNPATGQLQVWFMDGVNRTSQAPLNPARVPAGWRVAGIADLDANGKPDLVLQHSSGALSVWYMDGVNRLGTAGLSPARVSDPRWQLRAAVDMNGDGIPDLVWQHPVTGLLWVWFMNGTAAQSYSYLEPASMGDVHWMMTPQ